MRFRQGLGGIGMMPLEMKAHGGFSDQRCDQRRPTTKWVHGGQMAYSTLTTVHANALHGAPSLLGRSHYVVSRTQNRPLRRPTNRRDINL
jgi:hypothetical protein